MEKTPPFSNFQFVNNAIRKLNIENSVLDIEKEIDDVNLFELDYKISQCEEYDDSFFGTLQLRLELSGTKEGKCVIKIELIIEGAFSAEKNESQTLNMEDFQKMLVINGCTGLYSIARSIIVSLSALSVVRGQIRLPMLNVIEFVENVREQQEKSMESPEST